MPPNEEHEYDMDAILADVNADLFPSSSDGADTPILDPVDPAPAPSTPVTAAPVAATPATPIIDPVAQLAELDTKYPLPKSWAKDSEPAWKTMTEAQRALVVKREGDISRGIQQYQSGYQSWDQITKPYAALMQQHPDVNPVQLYQNLMESHVTLMGLRGPDAKQAKVRQLLEAYGITLDGLNAAPPAPQPAAIPPEFLARVAGVESFVLSQQERAVNDFFADPKNEFADDVAPDIQRLLETGQAKDLQSAYEQALWLNPAVREKLVAKKFAEKEAEAKAAADKTRRINNLNRGRTSDSASDPAPRATSMDETIDAVVAKHYSKH